MKTNNDNTQAASVAQSDSRPTGDQEVAGSIPAGSGNTEIDHDTFSTVILSLPLIQEGQLSDVHKYCLTA